MNGVWAALDEKVAADPSLFDRVHGLRVMALTAPTGAERKATALLAELNGDKTITSASYPGR